MIKVFTKHLLVRYIISGGTSAVVNLSLFALFFFVLHVHYIISNVIAFCLAFFVSLGLQKFWTFKDHSTDNIHVQTFLYLLNSLFGLLINTSILYICVHFLSIHPFIG